MPLSILGSRVLALLVFSIALTANALALEAKDVVGKWTLDQAASKAAADGNTAGLMKELIIKDDGTFEAMYGTKGTWKIAGGTLLVSYANDVMKDRPGSMTGKALKFPAPAMHDKFCYMLRVGDPGGSSSTGTKAPASTFTVGQNVKVEWKGTWYDAVVLAIKEGQYQVHYKDFDASWDEWVGSERIKK